MYLKLNTPPSPTPFQFSTGHIIWLTRYCEGSESGQLKDLLNALSQDEQVPVAKKITWHVTEWNTSFDQPLPLNWDRGNPNAFQQLAFFKKKSSHWAVTEYPCKKKSLLQQGKMAAAQPFHHDSRRKISCLFSKSQVFFSRKFTCSQHYLDLWRTGCSE